jgi:hypothetical protein
VDRLKARHLVGGYVLDLLFIIITIVFFAVAVAYVAACERLE